MTRFTDDEKSKPVTPCSYESSQFWCQKNATMRGHDGKMYCSAHYPENPQDWRAQKFAEWKRNNPYFEPPRNAEEVHIKMQQLKAMIQNLGKLPYDPKQRNTS